MQQTPTFTWAGRALSILVVLILLGDASIDLFAPGKVAPEMAATSWPIARSSVLGLICLVCALLYAIPRTAFLGAILVTGFFGGAIATHLRVESGLVGPEIFSLVAGAMAWGGLWLRAPKLRDLMPLSR